MKDLDIRQELLVITMEECGELIQSCSKALRRGELFPNSDSEMQLKQEIADVYCMIELMQDFGIISWEEIENGVERKRNKLARWSKLINPTPPKTEQTSNEPYTQKVVYGHTPPFEVTGYSASHFTSEPMTEQEEREWERLEQIQESQKRGKETI